MGTSSASYGLVAFFGIFLGIILFFVDGMLLWSIAFFSLGLILILLKLMWGFAGWADNVTRKLGED
jgi:hypothetical protein